MWTQSHSVVTAGDSPWVEARRKRTGEMRVRNARECYEKRNKGQTPSGLTLVDAKSRCGHSWGQSLG